MRTVAVSHLVKGHQRVSLLLLAAPESGKTTIAASATAPHITRVAMMSGRSVVKEIKQNPTCEFLLFNDLTTIRAMAAPAVNFLITMLNQATQGERGKVAFAGRDEDSIDREIGIIGCLAFDTFLDHRSKWRELGFISRMIPFAYRYSEELIMEIKDHIDAEACINRPPKKIVVKPKARAIAVSAQVTRDVRDLADRRTKILGQIGIRLLKNYHCLVRAHALANHRYGVTSADVEFLRRVDRYVSVKECRELEER